MNPSGILGLAECARDPLTASLVRAVGESARELGLVTRAVRAAADEPAVETLLSVGLPQLYDDLLAGPATSRRIAWFGEPLPRPADGRGPAASLGRRAAGIAVRALRRPAIRFRRLPLPRPLDVARAAAYVEHERRSNLAAAVRRAGTVDLVVVTSRDRASVLAGHGVPARVVPFGYHAAFAGPIVPPGLVRDIPAIAFGSGLGWSSRRARGLRACAERLGPARLVTSGSAWGPGRDALLRRSRVLLDVHRVPGNFIGLRVLLAAAAGAVLVTEPMDDPSPFEAGRHYVEAPLEGLPSAIDELLGDEPRRRRIAEAGQALITGPLAMARSLAAVLA